MVTTTITGQIRKIALEILEEKSEGIKLFRAGESNFGKKRQIQY